MATEKRLIDANALPISFDGHTVGVWKCDLDAAPTVDAVEVVRCGECGYCPDGYVCFGDGDMMPPHPTYPDRHCSCGKRRTDNG